jgi:hypothetical protein
MKVFNGLRQGATASQDVYLQLGGAALHQRPAALVQDAEDFVNFFDTDQSGCVHSCGDGVNGVWIERDCAFVLVADMLA